MKAGDIVATGQTEKVLTKDILEKVFNIDGVLDMIREQGNQF